MAAAQPATATGGGRFAAAACGDDPVPVLAAPAKPPTCRSISTASAPTRALNTVTVRPQVDGKLISVNFKEGPGRQARRRARRDRSGHLPGAARPGDGQEGAGRGAARQCPARPRALQPARRHQCRRRKQQVDTQRALVAQLEAQVQADQAAIDNAQRLSSTTPRSSRRSTAAPASARSTKATSCAAADATGIVMHHADEADLACSSPCRSSSCAQRQRGDREGRR